ncbi:hypothetical protein MYCTH_2297179 [Thermothelomyces thermophilus ATCC 42464]|uniref:BTB domain transcription factor n=1 Tax=Thermothelomyces thermophilus (strain ATCC 42464 / BCRC 31852 / DSM 1799) TaxID=573729 RepID=G2Q4N7_THET4|nr:uncharacterized protein MYCTH_2297179 [Thermothelomyces thermophilus ATCC 42464]AEO54526.1 hypothetical protein MYCTH_2297179 [Thermothelomyces thermophilus ATCC 42464]
MTTTTRSAAKNQDKQPSGARLAEEAEPGTKHKTEPEEHTKPPSPKRAKKEEDKDEGGKEEAEGESKSQGERPQAHDDTPSSILEKGVIYFFFRGRVNVDDPSSVSDIARTYILLRPIDRHADLKWGRGDEGDEGDQSGEKEGGAPLGEAAKARLLLVPKKTLPRTGRDRWVAFVEKAGASLDQLRDEFLAPSGDYETKTAGTRHVPAATPVAEGVYAITTTGRASHLVYLLTLPHPDSGSGSSDSQPGEIQRELGLKERGSFIISTKNPEYPGPANARLPKGPDYPKELLEEFRSLRWVPTQPKHLDYVNTQFLLIGESSGTDKALEPQKEDQEEGKAEPAEEMEMLEEEDEKRMKSLADDDAGRIYTDLQAEAKNYPKLLTTFP